MMLPSRQRGKDVAILIQMPWWLLRMCQNQSRACQLISPHPTPASQPQLQPGLGLLRTGCVSSSSCLGHSLPFVDRAASARATHTPRLSCGSGTSMKISTECVSFIAWSQHLLVVMCHTYRWADGG